MNLRISFVGPALICLFIFLSYYTLLDYTNPQVQFYSKSVQNNISKDVGIYQDKFSNTIDDLHGLPKTLANSPRLNKGKIIHVSMFTFFLMFIIHLLSKFKCNVYNDLLSS